MVSRSLPLAWKSRCLSTCVSGKCHWFSWMLAQMKMLNLVRKRPPAVLCSNDMTAIGVIRQAYDGDIKIPNDLSVVGFDDIRLAQFTTPPLTTVQMSQSELAKVAFRALINEAEQVAPAHRGSEYALVTNLVVRRSTTFTSG